MSQHPVRPSMTIGRQVLSGYVATLLVLLLLAVTGLVALDRVADAKDRVIEHGAPLVADAHQLKEVAALKSTDNRAYLLTGDRRYLDRLDAHDIRFEEVFASMLDRVSSDTGRRYLTAVRAAKEVWDREAVELMDQVGTVAPVDLGVMAQARLFPAAEAVADAADALIARERQVIAEEVTDSDAAARRARALILILSVAGLAVAVGVGGWVTRRTRRRLSALALDIDAAAAEILASMTQQVAGAAQQATAIQETVATVEELSQATDQSAQRARTVADGAQESSDVAHAGMQAVADASAGMDDIRNQVGAVAATVLTLAERAEAISEIVGTVNDIAERTHLLALNASIEAARAGEHGRGFGVVAAEVRALADEAKQATSRVSRILGEIQDGSTGAAMAAEEGTKSVAEGSRRVEETGRTIGQLADTVASAAVAAEQIAASSNQQAVATSQISDAMRNVDEVMEQNLASARQVEQAARDLDRIADQLKTLVGAD